MNSRQVLTPTAVVLAIFLCQGLAGAQAVRTGTLVLNTAIAPRTSVQVSTSLLQFDVAENAAGAEVVVSYRVAAHTRSGGMVRLTVEPAGAFELGGGAGPAGLAVVCSSDAGATALASGSPAAVAAWRDSGLREGTIRCRLDGAASSGRYSLPVKFAVVLD